ncbi:hypothetical protein MTR67_027184 [Solanum verrucosum]|uniref:Response regulatory domain-containing protein n=1 Tax=Solanum verrucosum TaxID=315347 RepID=A0AAF0R956_SOLVR|nr:hypothetical protein MTR67_027184 [Solanum verrucosum]
MGVHLGGRSSSRNLFDSNEDFVGEIVSEKFSVLIHRFDGGDYGEEKQAVEDYVKKWIAHLLCGRRSIDRTTLNLSHLMCFLFVFLLVVFREGLHVMLVDHDEENVVEMVDLLEFYGYKVVSDEYNELLAKKALKEGAYLFVKRPLSEEIVKHLWQFILTKKIQKDEVRKESEDEYQMNVDDIDKDNIVGDNKKLSEEKNNVPDIEEQSGNIHEAENNIVSNGECKLRRRAEEKIAKRLMKEKVKILPLIRLSGERTARSGLRIFMQNL